MADPQNPNQMNRLFQTAGSTQAKQGTGYTNLGRLLSASKDNLLGQKVAGTIGSQVGGVQQQLAEQQKAFGEESEKSKIGGQKDIEQREAVLGRFTSPSGAGGEATDEDVSAFERFRSGQYAGPQGLKDTSALKGTAQQLQGQVSNFSPSGTQELLRRSVGGDRYTQGQQRLDTLLMDKSKLTPIARQAQGLGQQISRADLAASGQAELQKNLAQQFAKETQEKLTGGMGGIETAVQGQLAAAQAQEKDRLARIQAIQEFSANKRAKVDASGKPLLDQYGNVQYDTNVRGEGDQYSQVDRLKALLSEKGAQTPEIEQLFGTKSAAALQAQRAKEISDIEGQRFRHTASGYSQEYAQALSPESLAKYQGTVTDAAGDPSTVTDYSKITQDIYSGKISQDEINKIPGMSKLIQDQIIGNPYVQQMFQPKFNAANESLYNQLGVAGQSLRGGSFEPLYQNLAKTLANSQAAQGLTEGGVASEQQRANYEALNRLMGKTSSESKYRKDDPTKYEAGKFLLNPEQIKRTL